MLAVDDCCSATKHDMPRQVDFTFSNYHFSGGHPHARALFRSSVSRVEVEVSSYCNRVCPFCPNAQYERRSVRHYMSDALYSQIVRGLGEIGYAGLFCFHRYNEPLAERDYILERIRQCGTDAPAAMTKIYTNGDYLNGDYFEALHRAGLREMFITVYLGESEQYSDELMQQRVFARLKTFGYPYKVLQRIPGLLFARIEVPFPMKVLIRGVNFDDPVISNGVPEVNDRGGFIERKVPYVRRSPCLAVFTELQVEMDGTVLPCCNFRTDIPEQRRYAVGRIGVDGDMFEIWSGAALAEWRRRLFLFGEKDPPCASCTYSVQRETPQAVAHLQAAAIQLGLTAPAPRRAEPISGGRTS